HQLANARRELGDLPGSIAAATSALDLDPKNVPSLVVRAAARKDGQQLEEAIADASRAIELLALDPRAASKAYYTRALCRVMLGERESAIRDLEDYLRLAPQAESAARARAKLTELRQVR
ncbi:MAG: tetratricopeptide repeat protein, partial [Planctomycetota bacterium]